MRAGLKVGVLEMSITSQALDGVYGRVAAGVRARLEQAVDLGWRRLGTAETDGRGRILDWAADDFERGLYRIVFDSDQYFVGLGLNAAYPEITAMFRIADESDSCLIQVTLSPHSYSIYFGTDN